MKERKPMYKKLLSLLMVLVLGTSLVACGDTSTSENTKNTNTSTNETQEKTPENNTEVKKDTSKQEVINSLGEYVYKNAFTDIDLKTYEGDELKDVKLSDFKGKVIVLAFWASWCPNCREELPILSEVAEKYKDNENVVFVPVDLIGTRDGYETSGKGRAYLQEQNINLPVFEDSTLESVKSYGIFGIPTILVYGKDGLPHKFGTASDLSEQYAMPDSFHTQDLGKVIDEELAK